MARIPRALALIMIILLVLVACSAGDSSYRDSSPGDNTGDTEDTSATGGSVRRVIYYASLRVSVKSVDQATNILNQRAAELGGYVSDSFRDTRGNLPSAQITYRIPQDKYTEFLDFARKQGEPGRESVNSTDVTEEFVDLEARLANRLVHEERLLQMLTSTATLNELLAVEKELARVREDIEVIQGRLRYLGDLTSLAKVEINLDQLAGETNVPGLKPVGISETARRSLRALVTSSTLFLDVISFLFVALAALLPFAIPLTLCTWVIILLRRRKKSKAA